MLEIKIDELLKGVECFFTGLFEQKKYSDKDLTTDFLIGKLYQARERNIKVSLPEHIYAHCIDYARQDQESFLVVTLNGAHEIIKVHEVSKGLVNRTMVHPREVFRAAIKDNAVSIIVSHNHPSGQNFPSAEDKAVTRNLRDASKIIGIKLLDHIIISKTGFYSFADQNEESLN